MAAAVENDLPPLPSETTSPTNDRQTQAEQSTPSAYLSPPSEKVMQKFILYKTRSTFYIVGWNKSRTYWRVLKIDRLEPSELQICEDPATYSETECSDLLRRIHQGNTSSGGLRFVTVCFGIVGFIRFHGPYYMLLITERRKIGAIYGHNVYSISKSEMIPVPNPVVLNRMTIDNNNESRYKKLLCTVDLTKDFFFSYSYHVMRSLQKNMCESETGDHVLYDSMFVWNEFLTRGIRNILQNTLWTVALVYGFFRQGKLSISGREFKLILIARRSRHYAGTRYLKRGVNEKGRVANDVDTEQIVFEDVQEGVPWQISSIVQNRGSIPLFWSQETSRLNLKPAIILSKRDEKYEATRLHFENLVNRYGNPIIILNLIKTNEKKPRESILRTEFANAIEVINKDLPEENRLKFLHWDLHKHSRSKSTNVLLLLGRVATYALTLTGFFYCQLDQSSRLEGYSKWPCTETSVTNDASTPVHCDPECEIQHDPDDLETSDPKFSAENILPNCDPVGKPLMFQNGVLRTNCIDCLDRTNVAQYAYGLAALGHQLHALGIINSTKIDLDDPLAEELMGFYEKMGDTLAHQYGGSAAHNKIFSLRRGQWKAAVDYQEFFRTIQRYYNNAYVDAEKQNAINVFLGNFQPQAGKPEVWELDSDQNYKSRNGLSDIAGSSFKRSMSDGNILHESCTRISGQNIGKDLSNADSSDTPGRGNKILSESTPNIPTGESDVAYSRYTPSMPAREHFVDMPRGRSLEHENGDTSDCSNFLDLDWLSSSGNSCEEETFERSMFTNEIVGETTPSSSEYISSLKVRNQTGTESSYDEEFPDSFVQWVTYGETLCH